LVTLAQATAAQRGAVERLLGRRAAPGQSISVRLDDVETLLRQAGICDDLGEAMEALGGPLIDARARRQETEAAWTGLVGDGSRPWLEKLRATGLLRRLARNDLAVACELLRQALEVDARLTA
jgi:hypothetical protein